METELIQQLQVDEPLGCDELILDGFRIPSIDVLLQPALDGQEPYATLDQFENLINLSMNSTLCQSLKGFPSLPELRTLSLADNKLSIGFEALADADLQSLERLDLAANSVSKVEALEPLDSLGNLRHLVLEECEVCNLDQYREQIFEMLPQLLSLDGMDRDGNALELDQDESDGENSGYDDKDEYSAGNEDEIDDQGEDEIENDDEEEDEEEYDEDDEDVEDQLNQPPVPSSSNNRAHQVADDESEDIGSEDEDDEEDSEGESESDQEDQTIHHGSKQPAQNQQRQHRNEDDDDELEEDEDEDVEEDLEEESSDDEEEEEGPGLAYLIGGDLADENDDEFEPQNDVEDESEDDISDADADEYGNGAESSSRGKASNNIGQSTASTAKNGGNTSSGSGSKRPRSNSAEAHGSGSAHAGGDEGPASGLFNETTDGFGMDSFDGPATFDDESEDRESKRARQ